MTNRQYGKSEKRKFGVLVILAAIGLYALWTSGNYVLANITIKTVHVFPTAVSASGWNEKDRALTQELSAEASFGNFTRDNSAFISIAATPIPEEPIVVPPQEEPAPEPPPIESPAATSTEVIPVEPPPETSEVGEVLGTETSAEGVSAETLVEEVIEETPPTSEEESVAGPESPEEPAPAPETETATSTEEVSAWERIRNIFSGGVPTVFATTTDEADLATTTNIPPYMVGNEGSTSEEILPYMVGNDVGTSSEPASELTVSEPEPIEDVAICTTLGKGCYTMEFSGFTVSGDLTEKKFDKATINFSFANLAPENAIQDDRLVVRYFHAGRWRHAGEIFLNKELSNGTNGGYFTTVLDDLEEWRDFSDVKIVVEYDRASEHGGAELYLDAIWIDAEYAERVQDVLAGDLPEVPEGTPDNVEFELMAEEDTQEDELIAPDGTQLSFEFVDDLDEDDLVMRVDKAAYYPRADAENPEKLQSVVYASITNTQDERDEFRLVGSFPGGEGIVFEIAQFKKNVLEATSTPETHDITYFCEAGWVFATTSEKHHCPTNGDLRLCKAVSETGENCTEGGVAVEGEAKVTYRSAWVPFALAVPDYTEALTDELPAGHVPVGETLSPVVILPGQTVYFKITIETKEAGVQNFALLARGEKYMGDIDSSLLQEEAAWMSQAETARSLKRDARKKVNVALKPRDSFDGAELPEFKFRFETQRSLLARMGNRLVGRKNTFEIAEAELRHMNGEVEELPFEVEYGEDGEWTLAMKKQPRKFRPGKYSVEITIEEGSREFTDRVEFFWGVLAVNTNKTIYAPEEQADLYLAALDDAGNTICDAVLDLVVTSPSGGRQTVPVLESGSCGANNVTDIPDYLATYSTEGPGAYGITLTHITETGEILHRINDSFEVREEMPFVVERFGPTRIWPKAPYTMDITVTARRDFSGRISEFMPQGFMLLEKDDGAITQYGGDILELSWDVAMSEGETKTFHYEFDAPDISPYLYVLGPLRVEVGDKLEFEEARTWKIASDALGNYIEKKSSWSPTLANTWEAKDLSGSPFNVPANAILEIAVVNSDTGNEQFGGVRHASSSLHRGFLLHEPEPQGTTEMIMHVQASATSSIQTVASSTAQISFVLLGYWTNGYYTERFDHIDPNIADGTWGGTNLNGFGVASGTVAEMVVGNWDAASELTGGVRASTTLTRSVSIHESEAGGVNGVTMMVRATSSTARIQVFATTEGANNASIDYWLVGYWSQNPTGLDYTERFDTLTGPTSNSTWTDTALNTFSVPSGGVAEVLFANSADANLSMLLGVRATSTFYTGIDRSFNVHEAEAGGWSVGKAHVKAGSNANATISLFTDDIANDAWRLFGYWAASNTPALPPSYYDRPFESQKTGSSTPKIRFSSTDPDGSSSIVYQIQWDDDATLDDAPIGDRSSDSESGCSPNCFIDVSTGDTSPFNEGDQIDFEIQTALVSGTTYYWRVRAYDVNGSGIDSEWATTTSFTYIANTDPPQWMQTQDTQFDQGALSSTETYGSNAVRLTASAPSGALMAYGESTVQTPRYRTWNGTAWSTEGSAQSVGGTILWAVTKAGIVRDEYVLGTLDDVGDVNVQVYNGTSTTWGNLQEVTSSIATASTTRRGFDVAFESTSGDALVVFCDGDADPGYYIWNGSGWSGPGTVNLSSTNACEWIKLASDPVSDEIIVVSRDTGAGAANEYEAQVWDGSAWGNSVTLGADSGEVAHEGIAVEYEESGNQVVVAVSNGTAALTALAWVVWDGTAWNSPTTQDLGNDFEWGVLKRDLGSDNMALCYADQSDDLGVLRWDGSGWKAFQESDQALNIGTGGEVDGRTVSCEFETTTGRDGYLMVPYTDTTNARYVYMDDDTGFSAEASISTIQDSWTVQSVRTGDGKILVSTHDDQNGRYDEAYWDGSVWSTASTLENTPSDTTEPFNEPIAISAQIYVSSSGTITSDPIDFDWVPGRTTWGEAIFTTTEPVGTNALIQVMYTSGDTCSTLVPDGDLPGNSAGFDASASPINLTALSTSTYNRLCLKATLSSTNQSVPTLNDWTINWQRKPYLTQAHYRWYVNTNGDTPTDSWPSGGTDIPEDTAISTSYGPPGADNVLRLRMSVLDSNVALSTGGLTLKLQYAEGSTCSSSMTWRDVGAIGSTTAKWRGYNNAAVSDGATLPSVLLSTADTRQSYEEENDSATNPLSVAIGDEGEWDWVLEQHASSSVSYCFRTITSDNEVLNVYSTYPALITNATPSTPIQDKPFDNEAVASTSPYFEFATDDPEGNDVTYQIQVDDDYAFGSALIDQNSQDAGSDFTNLATPSDRDPYNSGQTVRYSTSTLPLTNNTTYYWRVRAKDRNNSAEWSNWSSIRSLTASTSITISTWHQTRLEQFGGNTHDLTEATSTHEIVLTPPETVGTTTSPTIDYDWKIGTANAWGSLTWTDTETTSDIKYRIEYLSGSTWALIPEADLPGNAVGFDNTKPVSLLSLSPTTYNQIRIQAVLTDSGATPRLSEWTISWGLAVSQPTLTVLFDNEKTGTTTPTFRFASTDPQNEDLEYEISFSQTTDFTASTTRRSEIHAGFTNVASSTDTSPFASGSTTQFKLQQADALTNGNTYWWRVRARDINGGNVWSTWSSLRSLTVDTTIVVSTWFQTTDAQFQTDTLSDTEASGSGSARITTTIREAFTAYAEGTVQAPRYRIWNGSAWGSELTAETTGVGIRFVEAAAAPTRDEYIIVTEGSSGIVKAQVYNGTTETTGNLVEIVSAVPDATQRGFDVAYETSSGDAIVVSCGTTTEAVYRVWNGSSWAATSSLNLSTTGNCEWIKLASKPASDELIVVARGDTTGVIDYEAQVWNGSVWGNSTTTGSQATANNEGIAVEYEESGGQAIVVVSDGALAVGRWAAWNGANWNTGGAVSIGGVFAGGRLARDLGSDELALCLTDTGSDHSFVEWSGSAWGSATEFELTGNSQNGRPISCEYETTTGRDNYVMIPSSDTAATEYTFWDNVTPPAAPVSLSTLPDSWELRTARTGDGNILMVAYNDADTEYDFSYWNGSAWSTYEILETSSISTVVPATIPIDVVARRYTSVTSGTVVSSSIDFDDGSGPKWENVTWNDTTAGGSDILYQVEYFTSTSSWAFIPTTEITGNNLGTTTSPIDLGNLDKTVYNTLRLKANFSCGASCPTLNDWTLAWSEGIDVSGTAQQFDQSTNVTSGTVAVAINGTLQVGKTATISGSGTWTIPNVTVFSGDVVTVFVSGGAASTRAVGITKYDGNGDISGIPLYQRHLTIGSNDNQTITNTNISQYDYTSALNNSDLFYEVDAGNDLAVCRSEPTGECFDAELFIKTGNTYRPDSASGGDVSTRHFENNGTMTMDGNTFTVTGSWDNNGTTTANTSTVTFAATSTTETFDTTGSAVAALNNVTFGSGSGTATWNLSSALDVDGNLAVNFGTLNQNGNKTIHIGGNLTIGSSGLFTKGTASTTFDGSSSVTWTDNSSSKQDMGTTSIDGTTKTVTLGSAVKATNLYIGADDTFSVSGSSFALEVAGNFTNNNVFTAQSGTVTFSATSSGKVINPGTSSFYGMTFNGVGGNWSFSGTTFTATNDVTITAGTLTLPTATSTIGGSFTVTDTFMHNNGVILFNSSASKSITASTSPFYGLAFNGSGSWSFTGNATSSHNAIITAGTVTLPSSTLAVAGSFLNNGGTVTHNGGTLKMTATNAQVVRLNSSSAHNLTFAGSGGSWSFTDVNATSTNTVRFENGAVTLPATSTAVGGSWVVTGGTFAHNNSIVRFASTDVGETITASTSPFYNLVFDGVGGGWTINANATSTASTTLTSGNNLTVSSGVSLEVGGQFTSLFGNASTTWAGSTLFLNSGTSYSINASTTAPDGYGTLMIGANTDIKMWNSSSTVASVNASGSLYSQDNANQNGDLYIWGDYVTTQSEHWSYATDFDGTALSGGNRRQVDVRLGSGASVTASSTVTIVGDAAATTTVANQGAGSYSMKITGGTVNAQYYSFTNTDTTGLWLTGVTNVTSLADGEFALTTEGGTSLTVEASVIDRNPAIQIQRVRFDESITAGSNVRATSTPTSYWWFRNHYGDFDGEANDDDVGGNPGFIRWDDSSLVITVAGNVYADHGTTTIGNPPCDGSTSVVRIVVNGLAGQSSYSGSCNAGTGAYSIPNVTFSGDVILTAYLNTNGGARAVTVTKTPSANITNFHLYQNTLIVRHEDVSTITIDDLNWYDNADDSDIFYAAATTSTDVLTTQPNTELYIWSNKTFAPGGNVTLESGGSGSTQDGRLYMATSSTFTAAGTESHSIGGGFTASTSATLIAANSTFTFAATTSSKLINASQGVTFYNLTFNGTNGGWNLQSTATTTVSNTLTMTAGTLSGVGNIAMSSGALTGNGTIIMTGGTVELTGTGNLGSNVPWQFNNLTLTGSVATTTKTGTATTTILGVLRVNTGHILKAGSGGWNLSGSGTPFVADGTFTVDTAPFYYTSTAATNVADETYDHLVLAPSGGGSPTYTIMGGTLTATTTIIGNGTHGVTVTADTNDPSIVILDDLLIQSGATLTASSIDNGFQIAGSWTNQGTFNHTDTTVLFNSSDTGETIDAGSSSFYKLTFNNSGGGWTIAENATSSNNTTLTNASAFTVSSGRSLAVGGTFTNAVGGSATTWTGSTLYLNSGTSYSANAKTISDTYGNLLVGANTDVQMWNSTSTITVVDSTGSLYSKDHNAVDGSLYIWGDYVKSSGSDYWSYETDFDGTALSGGSVRQANVRIASSSTVTSSGGVFDILGTTTASTTISAMNGVGRYSVVVSGGTFNASYYQIRNLDQNGLQISGTPTVSNLSSGDFESDVPNGSAMITVAASVIDQNPLKTFTANRFATSTAVATTSNVTVTGTSVSTWNFDAHYGNRAGEAYDVDPAGDPGYVRWDDSASAITISGNVWVNEGYGVSSVCNGTTPVVRLRVEGGGTASSTCNASTGAYSIPDIFFNPGDTITVFLNTDGGVRAANITEDPVTNIANMHLYENRVVVRHEDTTPLTIVDLTIYDSDQDSDIPFDAEDAATDTLILPPEKKLMVWDGKTFAPAGNVTLESGGSGASHDGTLHLGTGATFTASGSQTHSVGGSFLASTSASLTPANSTFTFTATTTGKTITPQNSSFYNITFNGSGGNWAFSGGNATSTNNFTISAGTVTLPTGTTTVGSSFSNTGGTFMHNNGVVALTSTASGKDIRTNGHAFYSLYANGSGGAWTIQDTNATTSNNFTIVAGTVTLASGTTTVGSSFDNQGGTVTHNSGTLNFTAGAAGKIIKAGGSDLNKVTLAGVGGGWRFTDANATIAGNFLIAAGSTTLPTGTLSVGGSFINQSTFEHASGTVKMNATATGREVTASSTKFYNLTFDGSGGGWTMTDSATTTNDFTLTTGSAFTLTSGRSIEVARHFTNAIGGGATTWTGTTLFLNGATTTAINTKSAGGDGYGTLFIGANTDISMWNSSSTVTTVHSSSSLYSQDHDAQDGDLYIWGEYIKSSGTDYWSRATDFDGTSLSGSERQVDVRIATSSTLSYSGTATLNVIGTAAATTTIDNQGVGRYSLAISAGTINFSYYQFRNLDENGLNLSGSPTVTSLSNGDFEMSVPAGGTLMTVAAATINANASLQIASMRFATSSGVNSGFNVATSGVPTSAWTFTSHHGNYAGEAFDNDGADACGAIRWTDSACLFVSEEHYRWRNDGGGEGAPSSEWYNASWAKRKKVAISNSVATAYTNLPVKVVVQYDADMQSDFDDLRFTDSSGTTSLDYWRESYVSAASSTVWVEVPSVPSSGSSVIYMYYGNGSAANAGSGTTTFAFFDDFEDDNITEYSGDTSYFDTDTPFAHNYTYGLDADPDETAQTVSGIRQTGSLTSPSGNGDTIRFYQYVDATGGTDDDTCTLFGVQASAQNYAVCFDLFSATNRLMIAKNVTSNAGSGTILSTTNVAFATGWYEVKIDWLSSGTRINVTVYNPNGTTFATVSSSDTTYTSAGGVGFSFWGQHGGWDFYSVRDYISSDPTYVFGQEQTDSGATWTAAEDTIGNLTPNTNARLRFNIQNTGAAAVFNYLFRLQYASKGAALSCEAVADVSYNDIKAYASCGSDAFCMATSTQFADGAETAGLLTYPAAQSFSLGKMVEDTSVQTASSTIGAVSATEIEYAFKPTDNASASRYCFRVRNGAQNLDNYSKVAEMSIAHNPSITNWTFNSSQNIALTEGASTTIHATGTVTDFNGYADLASATGTMYQSGAASGVFCSQNENNCYQIVASTTASACAFQSCSGNSCTLDCRANIQYHAVPTDTGAASSSDTWIARVQVEDSAGGDDVESSIGVEMLTLRALSVTSALNFTTHFVDGLEVGQNTENKVATTTMVNTGNSPIDINIYGATTTGPGGSEIGVGQQKFATSTFTYGSCSICTALTGTAAAYEVDLPKGVASTTAVEDDVYWGIQIPTGTNAGVHTGQNYFEAVAD